jgi:hypothetical protein
MSRLQWTDNPASPIYVADVKGKGRLIVQRIGLHWYTVEITTRNSRDFVGDFLTLNGAIGYAEREARKRGWA